MAHAAFGAGDVVVVVGLRAERRAEHVSQVPIDLLLGLSAAQDAADVQAAVKKVTEELGDTGRILVRESGTEPVVRVMVEAESEEICQKYVDMVVNVIKENGYVAG